MLEMSQVICGVVGIPDSRIANVSSQNKTDYLTKSQYYFTELLMQFNWPFTNLCIT